MYIYYRLQSCAINVFIKRKTSKHAKLYWSYQHQYNTLEVWNLCFSSDTWSFYHNKCFYKLWYKIILFWKIYCQELNKWYMESWYQWWGSSTLDKERFCAFPTKWLSRIIWENRGAKKRHWTIKSACFHVIYFWHDVYSDSIYLYVYM